MQQEGAQQLKQDFLIYQQCKRLEKKDNFFCKLSQEQPLQHHLDEGAGPSSGQRGGALG